VKFRWNHKISHVQPTQDPRVLNLQLSHVETQKTAAEQLKCTNLVLAAGPFTTTIVHELFEGHSLPIQNKVQAAHWYEVEIKGLRIEHDMGLRFTDAAKVEDRLLPELAMLARSRDNRIRVSGFSSRLKHEEMVLKMALRPARGKTRQLKELTKPYVNEEAVDLKDKAHIRTGRVALSVANGNAPIIDGVTAPALWQAGKSDPSSAKVWLCYGFGRWGTLLAPGAACMLVSRMVRVGNDEWMYRCPELELPN
jgi:glycine/D-amino acid oxidase-like deaminating enzyme